MSEDAIIVRGIAVEGRHGVDDERDELQPFLVDVELSYDAADAIGVDSLEKTIDYTTVVDEVRYVCSEESFELVETLADTIARRLLALGGTTVRVRVTKPRIARFLQVHEVGVIVERP